MEVERRMKLRDKKMEILDFIPEKIREKYVTFLLNLSKCYKCKKDMVNKPKNHRDTFPVWFKLNFEAQAEKADLVIQSNVLVDNRYICKDCVKKGHADFLCALCEVRKPTSSIENSFGDPPEFLCADCFNTVTAAEWEKVVKQLYEDHQYDHE